MRRTIKQLAVSLSVAVIVVASLAVFSPAGSSNVLGTQKAQATTFCNYVFKVKATAAVHRSDGSFYKWVFKDDYVRGPNNSGGSSQTVCLGGNSCLSNNSGHMDRNLLSYTGDNSGGCG